MCEGLVKLFSPSALSRKLWVMKELAWIESGVAHVRKGRVYTYRYTVTTRMAYIKMGSSESHFTVLLIVRVKVTRQCPETTTFFEEKGEPKRYRTEVLPLTSLTPYR